MVCFGTLTFCIACRRRKYEIRPLPDSVQCVWHLPQTFGLLVRGHDYRVWLRLKNKRRQQQQQHHHQVNNCRCYRVIIRTGWRTASSILMAVGIFSIIPPKPLHRACADYAHVIGSINCIHVYTML